MELTIFDNWILVNVPTPTLSKVLIPVTNKLVTFSIVYLVKCMKTFQFNEWLDTQNEW